MYCYYVPIAILWQIKCLNFFFFHFSFFPCSFLHFCGTFSSYDFCTCTYEYHTMLTLFFKCPLCYVTLHTYQLNFRYKWNLQVYMHVNDILPLFCPSHTFQRHMLIWYISKRHIHWITVINSKWGPSGLTWIHTSIHLLIIWVISYEERGWKQNCGK